MKKYLEKQQYIITEIFFIILPISLYLTLIDYKSVISYLSVALSLAILLYQALVMQKEEKFKRIFSYLYIIAQVSTISIFHPESFSILYFLFFIFNHYLIISFAPLISEKAIVLKKFIILATLVIFLPPLCSLVSYVTSIPSKDKINQNLNQLIDKFDEGKEKIISESAFLSEDKQIQSFIDSNSYEQLESYLQTMMVNRDLTALSIIKPSGIVIANANRPKSIGENLFEKNNEFKTALTADTFQNITQCGLSATIWASSKIGNLSSPKAILLAGNVINSDYISGLFDNTDESFALYIKDNFIGFSSKDEKIAKLLNNRKTDSYFSDNNSNMILISFDNSDYFIKKFTLSDSTQNKIGEIFLVHPANNKNLISLITSLIYSLFIVLLALIILKDEVISKRNEIVTRSIKIKIKDPKNFSQKIFSRRRNSLFSYKFMDIPRRFYKFAIIIIAVFSVSLGAWLLLPKPTILLDTKETKVEEKVPSSSLSMQLTKQYLKIGETSTLFVSTKNLTQNATIVEVQVNFDPTSISLSDISSQESVCKKIYKKQIDPSGKKIFFSCEFNNEKISKTSTDTLFSATITANKSGFSSLAIDPSYSYIQNGTEKVTQIDQNAQNGENIYISSN